MDLSPGHLSLWNFRSSWTLLAPSELCIVGETLCLHSDNVDVTITPLAVAKHVCCIGLQQKGGIVLQSFTRSLIDFALAYCSRTLNRH